MPHLPKIAGGVVVAIIVTGAILNFANQGTLGRTVQNLSRFVTKGYGAGAF